MENEISDSTQTIDAQGTGMQDYNVPANSNSSVLDQFEQTLNGYSNPFQRGGFLDDNAAAGQRDLNTVTADSTAGSKSAQGDVHGALRDPYLPLLDFSGKQQVIARVSGDSTIGQEGLTPPVSFNASASAKRQALGELHQGLSNQAAHEVYQLKFGTAPEEENDVVRRLSALANGNSDGQNGIGNTATFGANVMPALGSFSSQMGNPGVVMVNDAGQVVNGEAENRQSPLLQDISQRGRSAVRSRNSMPAPNQLQNNIQSNRTTNRQQPVSLWVFDKQHNLKNIPSSKYQNHSTDYTLAQPVYFQGDAKGNGSYGMYVTEEEYKEFMGKSYDTTRDFYQPGRRAVDSSGREIIVPLNGAEEAAKARGTTLLPLSTYDTAWHHEISGILRLIRSGNAIS